MMEPYMERLSCNWSADSLRLINTPSRRARANWLYVQECGYFKTEPPYFAQRAGLSSYLILYTISGRGSLVYQEKSYELSEGQMFWIDCRQSHMYQTVGQGWEFLWVHFYGNGASGYYQEYIQRNESPVQEEWEQVQVQPLRRLVEVNSRRGSTAELMSAGLLTELLTELLLRSAAGAGQQERMIPEYLVKAADYMDRHFKEEISQEQLAEECHVSRYHFSREFKRYLGISFQEYLITARITCAKELLKDTRQTVEEITYAIGMQNVSHFIRLFREREGMTPLKYRMKWRE